MSRVAQLTESREQIRTIIERVERLEEEKKAIADDIRDVYAEAKANGFDVRALRAIVKLRKLDADERAEQEAILETYMHALGMLAGTPLGEAAVERDVPRACSLSSAATDTPRTLTNPRHVVNPSEVQKIADRAQERSAHAVDPPPQHEEKEDATAAPIAGQTGHKPTAVVGRDGVAPVAASSSDDYPDIPDFLDRRGGGVLQC
jgi:uncharacterized protein (UPF0335 family)